MSIKIPSERAAKQRALNDGSCPYHDGTWKGSEDGSLLMAVTGAPFDSAACNCSKGHGITGYLNLWVYETGLEVRQGEKLLWFLDKDGFHEAKEVMG